MILAQTVMALPLVAGLVMGAVAAVPTELVRQVRSLGATPWQVRWAVLREVRVGVLFAVLVAFGRIISEVGAALMVGGNIQGQTRVLSTAIVLETGKGDFALALALKRVARRACPDREPGRDSTPGETGVSDRPAYSLEEVTVAHGDQVALDLPKFAVLPVETLCLVGPPGAGKSTLLRLLAGLDSPTSGRVLLRGARFDGGNASVALRRTVTLVFQRPLLMTGTVRSNVEYGLKLRSDPDGGAKAMAMLCRFHLAHLANRPATALSGGEAQLVALARALAFGPDVLLLDEPTNNLDPARSRWWKKS